MIATSRILMTGHARRVTMAKSVKKAKRPVKKKKARTSRSAPTAHEDNHVCGCDIEFDNADVTADADLPPARGGVEGARASRR